MTRMLIALAATALVLCAMPAAAGPFEDAFAAYNRADYATALKLFRQLADQGNPNAQFNIALMYKNGRGVPQDYAEAAKWFRLSADQGNASAQANLGNMYSKGSGVPQNDVAAWFWYRL